MLQGTKNILFDLGGVLFHIDYQHTIAAFQKLGLSDFESHFTQHQQNDLFDAFETGKVSAKYFVSELQKLLPHCSQQQIIDAWNAMLIGIPKENLDLLKKLNKYYRLFLLSNANELHIQFVNAFLQKTCGIESMNGFFEKAYYSQEIGMRKPHQETFDWVLNDADIKAEETLFIEDTAQHIAGAKKSGLKTHHLESNTAIISLFPGIAL